MNRISELLPQDHIQLGAQAQSKKGVFELAGLLFEEKLGIARAKVFDALLARERLGSTGLGEGIAIPHGRIKGLKQATAAVFRLASPVPFEAPDGKPVSVLIVLLVPEQATQQHLEILSEVAELLSDRSLREALTSMESPEALHQAISAWQPSQQ